MTCKARKGRPDKKPLPYLEPLPFNWKPFVVKREEEALGAEGQGKKNMRREGRKHGWMRCKPESEFLFAKQPSKPTNSSRKTGKCKRPRCRGCHEHPVCKASSKVKGQHKARSRDVLENYELYDWAFSSSAKGKGRHGSNGSKPSVAWTDVVLGKQEERSFYSDSGSGSVLLSSWHAAPEEKAALWPEEKAALWPWNAPAAEDHALVETEEEEEDASDQSTEELSEWEGRATAGKDEVDEIASVSSDETASVSDVESDGSGWSWFSCGEEESDESVSDVDLGSSLTIGGCDEEWAVISMGELAC